MYEFAHDNPVIAAMMRAVEGFKVCDVAEAAATVLAQCCLLGSATLDEAYAELERRVEDVKGDMMLNQNNKKFPTVS